MPLLTPSGKQFSLHKLMAMSTMLSPTHSTHLRPLKQVGGGDATSEVPPHQLYLSYAIQEHLRRVYEALCGPEVHLPRDRFAAWLAGVQCQPIEPLVNDTYKFEQFLEAVYYNRGFEIVAELDPAQKDLSKPISHYYISSSHNTYLSGNQLSSKSSTEAYKNVLIRGCRCIEIDVHNGESVEEKSTSTMSSSPKPDHKRHLSGSTLSSRAAAAVEKAEEKYEIAKQKLAEKRGLGLTKENSHEKLPTNDSLAIGNSIERPPSIRSMRNGEPLVLHGWTLTTPVGFRAVCKSIRETAFATSKLPIIVSLEVHADLEQQEIMVDIMKEEWKGLLVEGPHEACNPEERLPRLDEMLEKILIKVKKASVAPTASSNSLAPVSSHRDGDSASGSEDERGNTKPKKIKICEALSNLAVYTHSEHFVSFEAKSAKKPSHIFSIGENQIMELHQTRQQDMFNHNRDFFMRAYPAAFRINSSNLDPSVFWRKGVQMVAMNWQNLDHGMMLNEGMFAGEHGWVLKPPGYRTDATEPINHKTLYLKVTVYSGQHIPIPPHQTERGFHPYIRCELHVEKPEEKSGEPVPGGGRVKGGELKQKTEYKKGDHPDFGDHGVVLEFKEIKVVEELSFIRFKVEDAKYVKDSLAAWACIRLDRLQQGYRFVHLLDAKGQATAGLLLVRIEKVLK